MATRRRASASLCSLGARRRPHTPSTSRRPHHHPRPAHEDRARDADPAPLRHPRTVTYARAARLLPRRPPPPGRAAGLLASYRLIVAIITWLTMGCSCRVNIVLLRRKSGMGQDCKNGRVTLLGACSGGSAICSTRSSSGDT
ncbi:hypothetical protein GUJ93_ZPchr0006g41246 [Zizania palustris]|uniref:Uncharacterized protein n=1 Tax=Zizania palustris TaxID=103762 RepID=A0A8J5VTZ8_ZIZPA|nr:hypothetical protein GUJ93_ZPchr0006g41246 [Zizania palustris]